MVLNGAIDEERSVRGIFNNIPKRDVLAPDEFSIAVDQEKSKVWLLYDRPLVNQDNVLTAIYDRVSHELKFISRDGITQNLGATVQGPLRHHLEKAKEVTGILADDDGNIQNIFVVPLKQENMGKNI